MEHYIKFRPIKPRSPHLNWKVKRSHQSDKNNFYSTIEINDPNLVEKVIKWQNFYNTKRPHSALGGKTPYKWYLEIEAKIPIQPEVTLDYWSHYEKVLSRNASQVYRRRKKLER